MTKSSEEKDKSPKERTRELALIVNEEREKFRNKALVLFNQLFSDELNIYQDLSEAAEKLFEKTVPNEIVQEGEHSDVAFRVAIKKITSFFNSLFQEMSELVKKGQERVQKLNKIAEFQQKFLKCSGFFTAFADFKEQKIRVLKELQSLSLPHSMLRGLEMSKMDALINLHYEKYLAMEKSAPLFFEQSFQELKNLLKLCTHATQTVKRRLFEIFCDITPFQDLCESFQKLRAALCTQIATLQNLYFKGVSTSFELCQGLFDLAYEHDVQLLRNEIAFRATRLQELREQNIHLLQAMLIARRYLQIGNILPQESIYLEVCALCQELEQFLKYIENPFAVFKACVALENVNEEFRKLWIRMEGFEDRVQNLKKRLQETFSKVIEKIKIRLLRVADDIEEIEKEQKKNRPNLVVPLERGLHDELVPIENQWDVVLDECTNLEKQFPYCQPLSFFMAIDDFQLRKRLFLEAIIVDAKIKQATEFARALQYIKIFEEERIDTILDVLERHYLIEDDATNAADAFESYSQQLLRKAEFVQREVVLDIGLLDMRSLFDVDAKKLKEALLAAIDKAQQQVSAVVRDLEALKVEDEIVKRVVRTLVCNIKIWETEKVTSKEESAFLLKQLMLFCHFLFEAKMVMEAKNANSTGKYAMLISGMRAYVDFIEGFIEKRRQVEGFGKMPWLPEMHALHRDVETLELIQEEAAVYKKTFDDLFKKIEEIAEIKMESEEEKRARLKFQSELLKQVDEAGVIGKKRAFTQLLHHIPGYLA